MDVPSGGKQPVEEAAVLGHEGVARVHHHDHACERLPMEDVLADEGVPVLPYRQRHAGVSVAGQVDQPRSGLVPRLEDVQALEIFANQAVTALQSARAYETTRQMSVRDSLTEAFNHRYFQETLSRELARHERELVREVSASADTLEGVQAFLEKRAPRWQDR